MNYFAELEGNVEFLAEINQTGQIYKVKYKNNKCKQKIIKQKVTVFLKIHQKIFLSSEAYITLNYS